MTETSTHPSYDPAAGRAICQTIERAIAESIHTNSIVHLADEEGLCALFAECENDVTWNGTREFWGVDLDGQEWRVHVEVQS